MNYPYNPYNMRQDMFNQPTNIQNLTQTTPTQAQIYFVRSSKDMEGITPNLNVVYIGINRDKDEIYLRQMNNSGLIDFNTYSLSTGGQEKNEFAKIMERIDKLETRFLEKGGVDERAITESSKHDVAGAVKEQPVNATV